jgi:hypothetical protein
MGRGRWSILARRAALDLQGYLVTSYRSVVAQNARFYGNTFLGTGRVVL